MPSPTRNDGVFGAPPTKLARFVLTVTRARALMTIPSLATASMLRLEPEVGVDHLRVDRGVYRLNHVFCCTFSGEVDGTGLIKRKVYVRFLGVDQCGNDPLTFPPARK